MARRVVSTGIFTAAAGYTLLLVVPAGKKYEILETDYYGTAVAAGPCTYDIDYDGINALLASEGVAGAAGTFVARSLFQNHHLPAGSSWYVFVANTTAGVLGKVTYVEVDV